MKSAIVGCLLLCLGTFLGASLGGWLPAAAGGGRVAEKNGDVDGDGGIDISDPVYLLSFLFQGGAAPVAVADSAEVLDRLATVEEKVRSLEQVVGPACILNARQFGARGDDTGNDAPAIQAAIDKARADGGGVVCLPAGLYRLSSGIDLPGGVTLQGVGWEPVKDYWNGQRGAGTWLHVTSTSFVPLQITGNGAKVESLAFVHDQPSPTQGWAPRAYPYTIQILTPQPLASGDTTIRDVLLLNPTRGLRQVDPGNGASSGRLVIDRLWGQPLETGISIEFMADVMRANDVHFWPFWSVDPVVLSYTKANATGLESYRNDNPHFSNMFFLGYELAMHFGANSRGVTSKLRVSNLDCDFCRIGLFVTGSGTTGQITNMTTQGSDLPSSSGLFVLADGVKLQVANLRVTDAANNGVRVEGTSSLVSLENVHVDRWNQSLQGFPGIEAASTGATIYVGRARWFNDGNGAPDTGGPGSFVLDQ